MEKKLIAGLGNPGKKYQKTRHNVGFMVLDALAHKFGAKFALKKKLEIEVAEVPGAVLAKPLTFMNASGLAVLKLLKSYLPRRQAGKLKAVSLLIVHDEIDLPLGKIKSSSGRSAGHKGVDSIIRTVESGFTRLRIGIENRKEYRVPETEKYVLQNFTPEELKKLKEEIVPKAIDEIKKWLNLKIAFSTLPASASPDRINQP